MASRSIPSCPPSSTARALVALCAALLPACAATLPPAAPATADRAGAGSTADSERVPFNADLRAAELRELGRTIREGYSHLAAKQAEWRFDLDRLVERYEPAIRRADTWSAYEVVMVAFVCELHDAHLGWRRTRAAAERKRRVGRLGLSTVFAEGALVVREVWAGSAAERAGLRVGDRVVAIDGKPIEARFEDYARLRAWSRREAALYDYADEWPATRYDDGSEPRERELVLARGPLGAERVTLRIAPETKMPPGRVREPALSVELRDGVNRLRLRSLRQLLDEKKLDELVASLYAPPGAPAGVVPGVIRGLVPGLVIDLRDNSGGYEHLARELAGRFAARPVVGASLRVKLTPRARAEHSEWRKLIEDPAMPGWSLPQPVQSAPRAAADFPARLAVIIDAGCRSSCETLALQLRALGARLFGETTGGSSGAPVTYVMPWSKAQISVPAWEMVDTGGHPIEGRGVVPDEVIGATVADVAAGRDAAWERAAAWVRATSGAGTTAR